MPASGSGAHTFCRRDHLGVDWFSKDNHIGVSFGVNLQQIFIGYEPVSEQVRVLLHPRYQSIAPDAVALSIAKGDLSFVGYRIQWPLLVLKHLNRCQVLIVGIL